MNYKAYNNLIARARDKSEPWRVACVIVGFMVAAFVGMFVYVVLFSVWMGENWVGQAQSYGSQPAQVVFLLLGFGVYWLALLPIIGVLQGRGLFDLTGPRNECTLQFLYALRGAFPVIVLFAMLFLVFEDVNRNLEFATWVYLLPVSLTLILLQTGAEELVFRGYLQSQIAAWGAPRWVWMLLPSVLFGLGHYNTDIFGDAAIWIVIWATIFGLLAADLTARAGTLGPAIAFHFINNCFAFLILGFPDYMGGLALYVTDAAARDLQYTLSRLPIELIATIMLYISVRIGIRR